MKKVYTKPELEILEVENGIFLQTSTTVGDTVLPGDNSQDWNVL